ncbi:hypothetical protein GCM10023335_67900 [Streptomyces siamensis]|uniref:Uncharacterized protein n=1 Tax=Streptomyces siamensis TaxID=1274986 RepID=A0ABP9JH63_9ACTN
MVQSRCLSLLDVGGRKSDDDARTRVRLTVWGCVAGLVVALVIPVTVLVTVLLFGMPVA